ncbi:coatomer subunit beta-like isoform X1 [Limulus polyphemus]|uniref:Coatomer subunit beta-like isoform X1 n=1 Tax=Limulus polyphemus TaxID=6850 RepID=A0ABM1TQ03_LIMPO|nr:coatomer subunit beta-like isoform X1 [Limulus polyphemus]XP_022257958.1 coatomer subunit beta-like isoform X1 [Limulus polyphemus]XP_022257959.1 coatomer subunit beta-like isoform X1 [Limulus polyphemus]
MPNGEKVSNLLMTIVYFGLHLQNHTITKLLLIFWEIVPKSTLDGKLLQEMILSCDANSKDLQYCNGFIRGSTLCSGIPYIKSEPRVTSVPVCSVGDNLQLITVELIYNVCHANSAETSRFVKCTYDLLKPSIAALWYEAAGTLIIHSRAPRAMEELIMDILLILAVSDLEVRCKTLNLALQSVSYKNDEEHFVAKCMLILTSVLHLGKSGLSEKNVFELSISQAMDVVKKEHLVDLSSKVSKVTQLTGFSDPVNAEGYLHVNQYNIVLDVLILNQT